MEYLEPVIALVKQLLWRERASVSIDFPAIGADEGSESPHHLTDKLLSGN
jgi:hypothetical protein